MASQRLGRRCLRKRTWRWPLVVAAALLVGGPLWALGLAGCNETAGRRERITRSWGDRQWIAFYELRIKTCREELDKRLADRPELKKAAEPTLNQPLAKRTDEQWECEYRHVANENRIAFLQAQIKQFEAEVQKRSK